MIETILGIFVIAIVIWGVLYLIGMIIAGGHVSPFLKDRSQYQKVAKTNTYPRIIGYHGVPFRGYCNKDGKWIDGGLEFANVEIEPRHIIIMDTIEAREAGIPEYE